MQARPKKSKPARSAVKAQKKPAPASKAKKAVSSKSSSKKAASSKSSAKKVAPSARKALPKASSVRPAAKPKALPAPQSKAVKAVKASKAETAAKERSKGGNGAGAPDEVTAHGEPLTASETEALLDHVRTIVKRLPDTTEVEAWGHPTFRVNNKIFVGYGVENGTASLSVKTTPDMQAALVSSDPRFTIAAYVGKHGWVSMSLAGAVDLAEVEALVRGSYRLVAPTKLVRQLDEAEG